jgi:hypothetical protein
MTPDYGEPTIPLRQPRVSSTLSPVAATPTWPTGRAVLHEVHWVMDHIEALLERFTYTDEAREALLTLHMLLLTQSEHRAHWAVQANGGKPPSFLGEKTREVRP